MKAEELRIGNYVKDIHGDWDVMKVESIMSSTCRIYLQTLDEEYLADFLITDAEPIPLTSEWLEKLGFKRNASYQRYYHLGRYYRFDLKNDAFTVMLNPGAETVNKHEYYNIKAEYVHQLQNLYFALTGNELTLK